VTTPKPFLTGLIGKLVLVKLKWGMSLRGILLAFDNYINVHLVNTEEFVDGKLTGMIGETLIRFFFSFF
jgi:small nuclear ribonucleoprotein F